MKSNVYNIEGKVKKEIELPEVFTTVPRADLIRKAFRAISLSLRQPYGSSPLAGSLNFMSLFEAPGIEPCSSTYSVLIRP